MTTVSMPSLIRHCMNELIINLSGVVHASNFDEWKRDLISQIQDLNKQLVTDSDFDAATKQVKSFKAAENALKKAKQSAINQASEIQQLFAAIDEVSEEARQARLSLERQITTRKQEIKQLFILSGIEEIEHVIDSQIDEFKYCDLSQFLDQGRFETAVRGKAGIKGLEAGIEQAASIIRAEIAEKAIQIRNNKARLDSLAEGYKILFQDYPQLICLPEEQLAQEIDKRIARFELGSQRQDQQKLDSDSQNRDIALKNYKIVIELRSTSDEANQIINKIRLKKWGRSQLIEIN